MSLPKKRVKNNGIVPQYYVTVTADYPRDLYIAGAGRNAQKVQSSQRCEPKETSLQQQICTFQYCLLLEMREIYRRVAWNNHGKRSTVWRCVNRVERGPGCCDAPTVKEEELQNAVVRAIWL